MMSGFWFLTDLFGIVHEEELLPLKELFLNQSVSYENFTLTKKLGQKLANKIWQHCE